MYVHELRTCYDVYWGETAIKDQDACRGGRLNGDINPVVEAGYTSQAAVAGLAEHIRQINKVLRLALGQPECVWHGIRCGITHGRQQLAPSGTIMVASEPGFCWNAGPVTIYSPCP